MTLFDRLGDPNTWKVSTGNGYIRDENDEDILYDLVVDNELMYWVLDAIKEKYNRG